MLHMEHRPRADWNDKDMDNFTSCVFHDSEKTAIYKHTVRKDNTCTDIEILNL
jgi:hypothetical protein